MWDAFQAEYLPPDQRYTLVGHELHSRGGEGTEGKTTITAQVVVDGEHHTVVGSGSGPISAFVRGLRKEFAVTLDVVDYAEHALAVGAGSRSAEATCGGLRRDGRRQRRRPMGHRHRPRHHHRRPQSSPRRPRTPTTLTRDRLSAGGSPDQVSRNGVDLWDSSGLCGFNRVAGERAGSGRGGCRASRRHLGDVHNCAPDSGAAPIPRPQTGHNCRIVAAESEHPARRRSTTALQSHATVTQRAIDPHKPEENPTCRDFVRSQKLSVVGGDTSSITTSLGYSAQSPLRSSNDVSTKSMSVSMSPCSRPCRATSSTSV